jgi:hypothetical protein
MLPSKTSNESLDALGPLNAYVCGHCSCLLLLITAKYRFGLSLTLTKMRNQTRRRKSIEVMHSWSMSEKKT